MPVRTGEKSEDSAADTFTGAQLHAVVFLSGPAINPLANLDRALFSNIHFDDFVLISQVIDDVPEVRAAIVIQVVGVKVVPKVVP